ncbi:MAG: hypothetical protein GDA50_03680, partial [Alphaproteobacteria bacterium GM202ARS2]|nr:hypothetical protein [Alphaproteobacteria bacterium GM202ARS2]
MTTKDTPSNKDKATAQDILQAIDKMVQQTPHGSQTHKPSSIPSPSPSPSPYQSPHQSPHQFTSGSPSSSPIGTPRPSPRPSPSSPSSPNPQGQPPSAYHQQQDSMRMVASSIVEHNTLSPPRAPSQAPAQERSVLPTLRKLAQTSPPPPP